jgi:16S rRNA (adenine1518-N6/adenine1519-N6)-dimethyltransferase
MNLTDIKQALAAGKIQLTKSLGQNFLHDSNQLRRIVNAAELAPKDRVLEIGPGLGALTQMLVENSQQVFAIEKDKRLYDALRMRLGDEPRLNLLHADALDYLQRQRTDWSDWKVVSNLPYSVASPIMVELAKAVGAPERIVVTLQLEVAQRLAATVGQDAYGLLGLLVQIRFQPQGLFKIPPGCFYPVPDVDSACVTLVRRPTPLLPPGLSRSFEKIVKRGFSQRRKMMSKLLKADWPVEKLEQTFAELGIWSQARAETVSLEQFVQMARLLSPEQP